MRFVTIRDLRNTPGKVRKLLAEDDVVLTANGKPVAYLIGVEDEDLEEVSAMLRRARAQRAAYRMRRAAAEKGLDRISPEEIEEAIRNARDERARPR